MPTGPITPKEISVTLDRSTAPGKWTAYQACPLTLACELPAGYDFEGCTRLAAEIFTETGTDPVAASEVTGLDGNDIAADIEFTAAQMNQSVPGRSRKFHVVVYAEYSGDRLEVFRVGDLVLHKHRASQSTPEPPEPAVYLSQAALDAAVAELEADIAALEAASHSHSNKATLDLLTAPSGSLLYNGSAIGVSAHSALSGLTSADCHPTSAITGLDAALALLAPLASPQLTGQARITESDTPGLQFYETAHASGARNFEVVGGYETPGELELWGSTGAGNNPRAGERLARFGVSANSGGPHFTGAISVGDAATTRTNLGLTALATTTPGAGVSTFLATPSSANLAAALTDETGTGAAVFATSPTLVTPALGTPTSGTLTNCTGLPASGIASGYVSDDRLFPLRPSSFAGTYDDDFTGSGLDAKWSRQGLVSGDHTYQTGNGSWMSMSIAAGTTGALARSIHQAWTPADSTITCRLAYQQIGSAYPMMGPFMVDSSGNGVAVTLYNNANSFCIATLASWVFSSFALYVTMGLPAHNIATAATGIWFRLRKSGTTYYASVSYDGLFWGPEVSAVNATTMSRIGMGTIFRAGGSTDYGAIQHFDFFKVS